MNNFHLNMVPLYCLIVSAFLMLFTYEVYAGPTDDNHIHIEQVEGGDDMSLTATQIGYGNTIEFSFAHASNTFNFLQSGSGNSISWVSYWGPGKTWGGDVDGVSNTEDVIQYNGATYGRHIWGDHNDVDVYQDGTHTHNLDIHVDYVDHDLWQEGSGSHYNQTYFYGTTSNSVTNILQDGSGSHNSQITISGSEPTTLNLQQLGNINQSYTIQQYCVTVGGCTVNVSQGD